MKSAAQQIVHESETQRQHVRVQVPARAELDGRVYMVKDLSVSGLSLENVDTVYADGAQLQMVMSVPFESFSLNVTLKAFVTYYDAAAKKLGCQFTDLTREQLSILNTIIQSYMSGIIVTEGELLNVVARDNFVKIRKELSKEEAQDFKAIARRALPFLFMGVAALFGGFFVMGNIFEKLLVLKSYQATVQTESIVLRAQAPGLFTSVLDANVERVTKGQKLGSIEVAALAVAAPQPLPAVDANAEGSGNAIMGGSQTVDVVSPCDCYFMRQYVRNGLFRAVGEPIFKLLPIDAKPVVKAIVSAEDVVRLTLRDKVTMQITGEEGIYTGVVQDIEAVDSTAANSAVTIRPERPISHKLTDRPAYVEFFVR